MSVAAAASMKRYPLISCIMPTRDRTSFVAQAVRYFQRQDYPNRELIVVEDGGDQPAAPADGRIRYLRPSRRLSIGAKRNLACRAARGEIIAQWDDDDWYAAERLSVQAAPLLRGRADLSALPARLFFDLDRWEFWTCTPAFHRLIFVHDVQGGTLMFRRSLWRRQALYPDTSLAEDADLLSRAMRGGARLARIDDEGLYIYVRHAANTWAFRCGSFLDPRAWRRVAEPPLPPADRAFYARQSRVGPSDEPGPTR
jgi:glycosyltransferase involved in cell wall biosynthesis